ncbi:tryptophan-rich sensory protein [bacterium]|nr:tryptophan-rich sensory protein [bacterium]
MQNLDWFNTLNKPFLAPPDWLFTPVWIVLYIMIAASFFLFLSGGIKKEKHMPLIFFLAQLALNFAWSPIFFGMQNILGAFIIIVFLYIFLILTIITFFKHSKMASLLLIPYLIWISFAAYLNFGYLVLN